MTIPAGLLAAFAAGSMEAQATVPAALVHSTVRIVLGFVTCETAKLLARGVLSTMVLNRFKIVTVLVFIGVVGSLGFWQGLAAVSQDRARFREKRPPTRNRCRRRRARQSQKLPHLALPID